MLHSQLLLVIQALRYFLVGLEIQLAQVSLQDPAVQAVLLFRLLLECPRLLVFQEFQKHQVGLVDLVRH